MRLSSNLLASILKYTGENTQGFRRESKSTSDLQEDTTKRGHIKACKAENNTQNESNRLKKTIIDTAYKISQVLNK